MVRRALVVISLALVSTACKSAAERDAERALPAVEALVAQVPAGEPKDFVEREPACLDKIKALELKLDAVPKPPAGSPAAAKLGPAARWIGAARAAYAELESAFAKELVPVDAEAVEQLAAALHGGPVKSADEIAEALGRTKVQKILLWRGTGKGPGLDEDWQNLPVPARRAVDPATRFVAVYVMRVDAEPVRFVMEKVTAERKDALLAIFEMPNRRKLGVFGIKGEATRLPSPVPLGGTVLPPEKLPVIEKLLRSP
jgi:hypothetical protein